VWSCIKIVRLIEAITDPVEEKEMDMGNHVPKYRREQIEQIKREIRQKRLTLLGNIFGTCVGLFILIITIYLALVSIQQHWPILLTSLSVGGCIVGIGIIVIGLRHGMKTNSGLQRLKHQYAVVDSEDMYPPLEDQSD
jgi:hypothetical protein